MAAAEARAAWQRANRCFVQEDAKRAPKLSYCPSSSLTQNDSTIGSTGSEAHAAPSFMPVSWNPMNPNLSPDAKWWLQLQPNFGYQKYYICEQLSFLEEEFDEEVETKIPNSKVASDPFVDESVDVDSRKNESCLEFPGTVSCMNHGCCDMKSATKSATNYSQQPLKHKSDKIYKDEELLDWKLSDRFISKRQEKASSDLETPWEAVNKSEPWWRITDKDELASLVVKKSLEHIENCDLPKPSQMMHVSMDPFDSAEILDTTAVLPSPLGQKLHAGSTSDNSQNSYSTRKLDENGSSSEERGYISHNPQKLYGQQAYVPRSHNQPESNQTSGSDPSRAQLLEALRHSQTRARQAEMAAQKAYDEKEHIVKLLFRQASHLFAYKQWLQILQLESLCLQLKVKDHHISTIIPILPWMPLKAKKPSGKDKSNPARRKGRKKNSCGICKYAFLFAFGLGLAGAGLLFGWTLGWLLPAL